MAKFTIQTRDFDAVTFGCPDKGGYVRVYCPGASFDGKQACEGGGTMGTTLHADEARLEAVARKWWRQFLAAEHKYG